MKQIFITLSLLLFSVSVSSQEITQDAWKKPKLNAQGDPQTNQIDPNGVRRGAWYYNDFKGLTVIKREFNNNSCQATYFKNKNNWIEVTPSNLQSSEEAKKLDSLLSKENYIEDHTTTNFQQIAIVLDEEGGRHFFFLGEWDKKSTQNAKNLILNYLNNHETKIKKETILLL